MNYAVLMKIVQPQTNSLDYFVTHVPLKLTWFVTNMLTKVSIAKILKANQLVATFCYYIPIFIDSQVIV